MNWNCQDLFGLKDLKKATLEEDVTKHFTDEDTEEAGRPNGLGEGLINIGRVACTQVDISPIFSFSFLSRKIQYKENILTSCLLSDLVKRLKLESRARNYRDETGYREADMERRMVVIVDIACIWEKKDFIRILVSIKSKKPVLENVFRCEIGEGQSKNFSGLYILTFKDKLTELLCEQVRHKKVLYAGLLKDYITRRTKIIKENPIQRKVISRPPVPLLALVNDLTSMAEAFEMELSGFSTICIDIREYVINILKLEYIERYKDKVSDPVWNNAESDLDQAGLRAVFHFNVCDKNSEQLIQRWNDQDVKIKGSKIKARIM